MELPTTTSPSGEQVILQRDYILRDILANIDELQRKEPRLKDLDTKPLKEEVIAPVLRSEFDTEVQIRGLLRTLQYTPAFKKSFDRVGRPELKAQIRAFIDGKSATDVPDTESFVLPASNKHGVVGKGKDHKSIVKILESIPAKFKEAFGPHLPKIYEDKAQTKVMEVHANDEFVNWGETVKNTPTFTFVPTTVLGIQNLVRYASANNIRVRCSGFRHSWSPIFSQTSEILISFVNLAEVTTLPDPLSLIPGPYPGTGVPDLKTIELMEQTAPGKRLCRIGAAVTNEDFRRWALAQNAWALPVSVIMVEVTVGGVNAPICHGAGRRHLTVSDYVRRVEYVDCKGVVQTVSDPRQLKVAAGAFGLLGVVTHLTFELDAMSYAVMAPRKVDIGLAIPPLHKDDIPPVLRAEWYGEKDAEAQMESARKEFVKRARDDYYSEWFWFTYQQKAWVNTWNTVDVAESAVNYPSYVGVFIQWLEGWIGGVLTESDLFNFIPGHWQTQLLATMGMAALPPTIGEDETLTIKTQLPNALHFRRGIQNMRVRDTEFQIPIPGLPSDPSQPDFSVVQRAWWDVINLVYSPEYTGSWHTISPMRLTLELRIMGASNLILAPQRGNTHGTASIEILTVPDAAADGEWAGFVQKIADKWMALQDGNGRVLNVRPHWAKEWDGLKMGPKKMEARKYLREVVYKDAIPEFVEILKEIGQGQGWGLEEVKQRFSNELWDELLYGETAK
ncbi:hypothetical protein DFH08DRAFT_778012 [Mycena albidolilacea]|uniref:FAD-binding PCMH-type domain-containing protein n=1 Tax=Mycena albidolilacea TaxID=1033008 RepID=A0AAD7A419_9AGAR|nr:hypothetical protein DFH08DRAFT_778012 [Mycena albidolilacea]